MGEPIYKYIFKVLSPPIIKGGKEIVGGLHLACGTYVWHPWSSSVYWRHITGKQTYHSTYTFTKTSCLEILLNSRKSRSLFRVHFLWGCSTGDIVCLHNICNCKYINIYLYVIEQASTQKLLVFKAVSVVPETEKKKNGGFCLTLATFQLFLCFPFLIYTSQNTSLNRHTTDSLHSKL